MAIIQVRNLVKKFDHHTVIDGVDLDVVEGDVKVVMGPSGCGKSTLLRCINRLVEPTSGRIIFRDVEITGPDVDVRTVRQQIGFLFQQFALYRHLSVLDNVTLGLRKLKGMPRKDAEAKAVHELARLDMAGHRHKFPAHLSGGQKQRVALARALAMDPAVVFLDEPTSALDPVMTREVASLINRLHHEKVTMLVVTHDLALAGAVADKVSFMHNGQIRVEDSIANLACHHTDAQVRSFFSREENRMP